MKKLVILMMLTIVHSISGTSYTIDNETNLVIDKGIVHTMGCLNTSFGSIASKSSLNVDSSHPCPDKSIELDIGNLKISTDVNSCIFCNKLRVYQDGDTIKTELKE